MRKMSIALALGMDQFELMLEGGFVHASINCEDVHPEIAPYEAAIPHERREMPELRIIAKAGFGFGDVNACLVFRRWDR